MCSFMFICFLGTSQLGNGNWLAALFRGQLTLIKAHHPCHQACLIVNLHAHVGVLLYSESFCNDLSDTFTLSTVRCEIMCTCQLMRLAKTLVGGMPSSLANGSINSLRMPLENVRTARIPV